MKLSNQRIQSLHPLLKELTGRDYTHEQTEEAGMAIMRFVIAKAQRRRELEKYKENGYGQRTRKANTVA